MKPRNVPRWAWPWRTTSGRCWSIGSARRSVPRNAQMTRGSPSSVDVAVHTPERALEPVAVLGAAMDVAGCGDADRGRHRRGFKRFTTGGSGNAERVAEQSPEFDRFLATLKKVAGVLRENEIPFLLGGGLAAW